MALINNSLASSSTRLRAPITTATGKTGNIGSYRTLERLKDLCNNSDKLKMILKCNFPITLQYNGSEEGSKAFRIIAGIDPSKRSWEPNLGLLIARLLTDSKDLNRSNLEEIENFDLIEDVKDGLL